MTIPLQALCCVDKKGLLSWPNPAAEKVFFLRNSSQTNKSTETLDSDCYNSTPQKSSGPCIPQTDEVNKGVTHKNFMTSKY